MSELEYFDQIFYLSEFPTTAIYSPERAISYVQIAVRHFIRTFDIQIEYSAIDWLDCSKFNSKIMKYFPRITMD